MSYEQDSKFFEDLSQVFGFKEYRYTGGRADGMRGVDVWISDGAAFTVLVDKCMDFGNFSFKGVNYNYITKAGYSSPQYYDKYNAEWLKSFGGGLMVTCGLENVGRECEYENRQFGLHGTIGNTPAEEFCVKTSVSENNIPCIILEGKMRTGWLFGPNLWLTRKITCYYGENKVYLHDTIENKSYKKQHVMVLYHFNMGYPLLSPDSLFMTGAKYWFGRDDFKDLKNNNSFRMGEPLIGDEHCFYYKQNAETGKNYAALVNERIGRGIAILTDANELPYLVNWRSPLLGDYCLGIEPGNCIVEGINNQIQKGVLEYLDPLGKKEINITIELLDSKGIEEYKRMHEKVFGQTENVNIYADLYK